MIRRASGLSRRYLPMVFAGILMIGAGLPLRAQQITRVAVLNMGRVLAAFPTTGFVESRGEKRDSS